MPIVKPEPGDTGWDVAVDAAIDVANAVANTPSQITALTGRVTALENAPGGEDPTAEITAAVAAHVAASNPHTQYLRQSDGDGRYILQSNAGAFATDAELATGLATKAAASDVVSLNGRVGTLEVAPPAHTHTIADIVASGTRNDTTFLRGDGTFAAPPAGGGGGVTDHGALTGLGDDDHAQYHNDDRGDLRYYPRGDADTLLAARALASRTLTAGTGLSGGGNLTADRTFTVAYGTVTGTAAQGNDTRITGAAQKSANLSDLADASSARTNLGLGTSATRSVGTTSGTVPDGADSRFTDQRTPTDGSVTNAKVAVGAAIALSKLATDPLARANHTGTQAESTITGLVADLAAKLAAASNLSDLGSASSARTNLGLGGAAVLAVGTTTGTVAAGDDSRIVGAAQKASNLSDLASAATARTNLGLATVAATGAYADLTGKPLVNTTNVALTDAATVAIDATLGNRHKVTIAGNRTLGNPSGAYDGQILVITVAQDATGGRTVALGSKYRLAAGATITWSTTATRKDHLAVQYDSVDDKFDVVGFQPGFG